MPSIENESSSSDFYSDAGFAASRLSPDGAAASRTVPQQQLEGIRTGIWKAQPGEYRHPGSASGEVFIVVDGEAEIAVDEIGTFPLVPGSIITIPPNTRSTMRVKKDLRKFSVVKSL